eukprot:14748175-Alexandrium_andersonii.AAC.1
MLPKPENHALCRARLICGRSSQKPLAGASGSIRTRPLQAWPLGHSGLWLHIAGGASARNQLLALHLTVA